MLKHQLPEGYLLLTLNKKWFDMIASGEKLEEYREIKEYWVKRLTTPLYSAGSTDSEKFCIDEFILELGRNQNDIRAMTTRETMAHFQHRMNQFNYIVFKNGYSRNSRTMIVKNNGLAICTGKPNWGASITKRYFAFQLGEVLERNF